VVLLSEAARVFWAERHVIACPGGISAWQAPDLTAGDGQAIGRGGNCTLWVTDQVARRLEARRPVRSDLLWDCTVIFHEVGHTLGLQHTDAGLMSVVPPAPWPCRVLARDRLRDARDA
jgi:hypothetical protein